MFSFYTDYVTYEKRQREVELFNLEKAKGVTIAILHYLLIEKIEPGSSYSCTAKA